LTIKASDKRPRYTCDHLVKNNETRCPRCVKSAHEHRDVYSHRHIMALRKLLPNRGNPPYYGNHDDAVGVYLVEIQHMLALLLEDRGIQWPEESFIGVLPN
jgi:hypothetical protein